MTKTFFFISSAANKFTNHVVHIAHNTELMDSKQAKQIVLGLSKKYSNGNV